MLNYCLGRCKTQKTCDKAVHNFLPALKFVPDGFVTFKMVKNSLFADDDVLFLMKVLVMSHFLVMKWVFLVQVLIISTMMMLILMKMILKLFFMSNLWVGAIDLNIEKHIKNKGKELMSLA